MSVLSSVLLAVLMTEPGALTSGMGHVQGIDATDEAIYLSHDKGLFKIDWNGKLLASVDAPRHTGDICVWKGRIYTAAHVINPGDGLSGGSGGGLVEVYDKDLKLVKSRALDFGIDGITCVDGRLYVGIGRNHPRPMRGHVIGFLDAETLEPMGTCGTDYGHATCWGPQDLAYDGEHVWMMFYPAKGEPGCGRFTKDLVSVTSVKTPLSNGFCVAPKRFWRKDKPVYLSGHMMKGEKTPRVRIDFWRFNGNDFEKVEPVWSDILLTGRTAEGKLFYNAGETMTFLLSPSGQAMPPGDWFVRWKRTGDDGMVEEGIAPLEGNGVVEVKTSLAKPGFVRLEAFLTDSDGREVAATNTPRGAVFFDGGAGVEPEKLVPPPEPADFDAWWSALRERVAKTAPNPKLKEYPSGRADVKLFAFGIDSPAGPCTGWLATPTMPGKHPCRIRFFGYNESWSPKATAVRRPDELCASELRLWVNPHGFELARERAHYAALRREVGGKFGGHAWDPSENANPDTSYFRKMAERVLSALAYAKARPEWDGRTLIVNGGSQGGLQSVWAAAQDPSVTSADVWVLWNCDAWGKAKEGRLIGDWALPWAEGLRYFDAVTHAARISPNCRVEVSCAGLGDYISPPSGIAAFYNALRGRKRITWLQGCEHSWRPSWAGQQKETWESEE